MVSEADYILVVVEKGEGGTYRTTFRVEILARKVKNGQN